MVAVVVPAALVGHDVAEALELVASPTICRAMAWTSATVYEALTAKPARRASAERLAASFGLARLGLAAFSAAFFLAAASLAACLRAASSAAFLAPASAASDCACACCVRER